MKKALKYFLVGLLGLFVGIELAYGYTKFFKNKDTTLDPIVDDKEEKKEVDSLKLLNTKEENGSIVQNYETVLNNKHISFSIIYTSVETKENKIVYGTLNGYNIYNEVSKTQTEVFNVNYIRDNFNEKNFNIIKGLDDKSYLIIRNYMSNDEKIGENIISLEIYNDELTRIEPKEKLVYYNPNIKITLENSTNPWYNDEFKLCKTLDSCQIMGRMYNDKIHILTLVEDGMETTTGTLEERVYTINNNILNYTVFNTYTVTDYTQSKKAA